MSKNKHNKNVGSAIERSDDRINQTGEVFTPMTLCYQMVDETLEALRDRLEKHEEVKFLDSSAGSGNFPYALLDRLVNVWGYKVETVRDKMLYCVEFMEDNHAELCERLGVSVTHPHYVRADATTYDYSFGEPLNPLASAIDALFQ
ncbi:hypothetical protein [Synechococcus phage MA10]